MDLRQEIERLGRVIGADERDLVGFGPVDGGHPYVWADPPGTYHWRVTERGETLDDRTTTDPGELLFWAFSSTTFGMAAQWAREHPVTGEEYRITLFRRQFALLHELDPAWARRCRDELIRYLEEHDAVPTGGVPPLPG